MKIQFARRMGAVKPSTIREILKVTEQADIISFAGGLPAPELFPVEEVSTACERVLRDGDIQLAKKTAPAAHKPAAGHKPAAK